MAHGLSQCHIVPLQDTTVVSVTNSVITVLYVHKIAHSTITMFSHTIIMTQLYITMSSVPWQCLSLSHRFGPDSITMAPFSTSVVLCPVSILHCTITIFPLSHYNAPLTHPITPVSNHNTPLSQNNAPLFIHNVQLIHHHAPVLS